MPIPHVINQKGSAKRILKSAEYLS
uniref:Uncharacterized protein n=1 Tax=Arundo donax TaxID=35708 RepID=A0A0A8XV51_ARUDO